ncbi:DNA sulfur modification protein DndD [Riemerella anatipestifer]|uniref:DNA sulfur modification protein DndD n=1 Tax=Riemerella anatipestifer TaxID=34085 RepID=A0AAP6LKC2_RIEAN|nr:DNA sulfur modification protein DndD [Riemerella anatipestifer]MBT0550280.1 DNA sulfur modification protein DndD [Riemerella anatipestifer]MBT0556417.1 DNA sulfur modification protein DndD [Riemerella anatipestifer]MBT0561040.1 DNA sulfur modification protein DndD [Riemerella anatipestifer]MCD5969372.1 DNA sulfur modification protein DndD [Riemerella anatipestifer]MCO7354354.1 DNA sulfur modification protein DndD [Riemerella anatipestifer]
MFIKEIELNNFRIYKGINKINLLPQDGKNIIVVSGKNGFGKTTFLMSLVWCLYGKQMEKVDELYQKEIADKGGYGKYIGNSLNRLAKSNGETKFSVSVTFTNVKIPEITCNEIKITRIYDIITSSSDKVEVLIDGYQNELIQDLTTDGKQDGEEIFIRDFILPIEIAKFFFFDAEKIVSLAEINSPEQRRLLSKAYTEVLGIKKYEDLKDQLETIQDDYRKKSAKPQELAEFNQIETDIKNKQISINALEQQIQDLNQEKIEKQSESNEIQMKLIQEGNMMTLEQLNELKKEEISLTEKISDIQNGLKDLFDLIPFGLSGETLMEISNQLEKEKNYKENKFKQENVGDKTNLILDDLEIEKKNFKGVITTDIRNFYETQIRNLIKKHFFSDVPELPKNFESLHNFSDSETNELNTLINSLKNTFRDTFSRFNDNYSRSKNDLDSIRRKIRAAEKDAEDEYIANLRNEKTRLDNRVYSIDKEVYDLSEKIGSFKNEIKTLKQRQEELRKKIDDSRRYSDKDKITQRQIENLRNFIKDFKDATKKKLEENILNELSGLMHKKGFIKKVAVDINQAGDDVDINLFNSRNEKIDKGSLSMGERQMYASALLKALVDESDISFPVFIDSPMQKFDKDHAENVIKEFYPNVSDQVVLFPLIHKELTESEFELLKPNISKSYIIHNVSTDASTFEYTEPNNLIKKYNELYAN